MEEKLTFTRVPRSVCWLCVRNFERSNSKKNYSDIVDHFQGDPALRQLLNRVLPTGEGRPELEAQMSGYGFKGFRDRLSEMYLAKLETGKFPRRVEIDRVDEARDFEQRFEAFCVPGDSRVFMLGLYLKMKDMETLGMTGKSSFHISPPLEVDEILAAAGARSRKLDWMIVVLTSLLKIWGAGRLKKLAGEGSAALGKAIAGLGEKDKLVFLNDLVSYGHGIGEKDFFLYPKV